VNKANNHIFPDNIHTISRKERENLLGQNSRTIWMTGLSGAGKTTIARKLELELSSRGFLSYVLDGDIIRSGISNNLTFTDSDREENIRRIAEVSKLFIDCGIITINCFISPTEAIRSMARNIIGSENFIEVYINAPFEVCEKRDVKGLYSKARKGEIKDFTGIDSVFDKPEIPDIEIKTDITSIEDSVKQVLDYILPIIEYKG
jgi:adenylylsulfate kinase